MFYGIVSPAELTRMLKSNPDRMMVSTKFIAVYDSELDSTVLIPGKFDRMSESMARAILDANLKTLKE